MRSESPSPFLSVIIPCRNEAAFIHSCLESIVANDYPSDRLEILVVDGASDDGTSAIVEECSRRDRRIRRVVNPKGITPAGLNAGIRAASGEIIIRMDAHARIAGDYIRKCVAALEEYKADNVGGVMKTLPQSPGLVADAIVQCLSHRFGVGNSMFRVHTDRPTWVDTVFGGCYRREVFDRLGFFNEALVRGQDMEFNLRLRKNGGRILLLPDVVSYYYARSDLATFWRHNWNNGVWAILPFGKSQVVPVSWRHLVPLLFVSSLTALALASVLSSLLIWQRLLGAIVLAYVGVDLLASVDIAFRQRRVKYVFIMPWLFPSLHMAYGAGSIWGVIRLLTDRKARS